MIESIGEILKQSGSKAGGAYVINSKRKNYNSANKSQHNWKKKKRKKQRRKEKSCGNEKVKLRPQEKWINIK